MICIWVRSGKFCVFAKKRRRNLVCLVGKCKPIVEECKGCNLIFKVDNDLFKGTYCKVYAKPDSKWEVFTCPKATHKTIVTEEGKGKKINPLKKSKRSKN